MGAKKTVTGPRRFDSAVLSADASGALDAVARAGEAGRELIAAWVDARNVEAVATVAEQATGAARKAARRGLNVLKSRGVSVPGRRRVATLGAKPEAHEAWMMAPDTAGNVLFVLGARTPTSRYRTCFVFLHEAAGILRVQVGQMSQSGLREAFAAVLPGARYRPVRVPLDWARWRIAKARLLHRRTGQPEPLGLDSAGDLLGPAPEESTEVTHPFDAEGLVLSDEDIEDRASRSAELHALPEFRGWIPPKDVVDEMMRKVGQGLRPGEEPDPSTVERRVAEELVAATDRHFSPERRSALVETMKDSALSVLAREGEQRALDVVATMERIQRAGLITDPPHEVPFLKAFFEKALGMLVARGRGSLRIPVPALPVDPDPSTIGEPMIAPPAGDDVAPSD